MVGLILAISSWVLCPILPAVIALVLAAQSDRDIDASHGRLEGRSLNTATRWVAWAHIALSVVLLIASLVFLVVLASTDWTWVEDLGNGATEF